MHGPEVGSCSARRPASCRCGATPARRHAIGEIVWHYQFSPGDPYDYDGTNELVLADLPVPGSSGKVLMQREPAARRRGNRMETGVLSSCRIPARLRAADCLSRRALVAAGLSAPWSLSAPLAQTVAGVPRIGVLLFASDTASFQGAFCAGLRELGYEEGRNIVLEWRAASGQTDLAARYAAELVGLGVRVIVAEFTPASLAAQRATSTIPIVMAPAGDPVSSGLVKSLAQPGGNITGFSNIVAELAGKRLELLRSIRPGLARVGLLQGGTDPLDAPVASSAHRAAATFDMRLVRVEVGHAEQLDGAFAMLAGEQVGAIIVPGNLPVPAQSVARLALRHRMASISLVSGFSEAGGLMFYGATLADIQRRVAGYVDRILKGAKPGDLPVEQPTVFELVINLTTARALGLAVPSMLRLQATRAIE